MLTGRATDLLTRLGSRRSGGDGYPKLSTEPCDPASSACSRPTVAPIVDTGVNAITNSERPDQDDERNDQECSQRDAPPRKTRHIRITHGVLVRFLAARRAGADGRAPNPALRRSTASSAAGTWKATWSAPTSPFRPLAPNPRSLEDRRMPGSGSPRQPRHPSRRVADRAKCVVATSGPGQQSSWRECSGMAAEYAAGVAEKARLADTDEGSSAGRRLVRAPRPRRRVDAQRRLWRALCLRGRRPPRERAAGARGAAALAGRLQAPRPPAEPAQHPVPPRIRSGRLPASRVGRASP